MKWVFERVAGPYKGALGGLAWDGSGMLFSAIDEGRILRHDPVNGKVAEFRRYTNRTNGLAIGGDGTLYGCQQASRRIVAFTRDGSMLPMEHLLDGKYHNQPNNLCVDAKGSIWFTDPHSELRSSGPQVFPPLEHASVLRLDKEAQRRLWDLRRVTYDTMAPRALAVTADGRTLYVAETDNRPGGLRELRAYVLADGEVNGACSVMHIFGEDHRGVHRGIEGMCLDAAGNLFACAGWSRSGPGPMIYVFAPGGEILGSHRVPGDLPMNCALGDPLLDSLYVTTGTGELYRVRNCGFNGLKA